MIKKGILSIIFITLLFTGITGCTKRNEDKNIDKTTDNKSQDVTVLKRKTEQTTDSDDGEGVDNNEIIEITEKMFLTQINDIYYNFPDYEGRKIKVEGMYDSVESYLDGSTLHMVYRNGPGCCGNDGWGGFYLNYEGEYPAKNDWIQVIGTAQLVEMDGYPLLYLNVSELTVMEERGAEYVEQ
ncbi:putative membrane protein [Mobilisporobacter senegalensis]|uniref:Putative membrane protein n=1 Tax=Mobilisporobacter senegalensis TaxID=1329262 RepID=A0A3N1XCL3_9FIRM|nr:hypothetical protein [Mobilisporobacter senegalensis]ROR23871.1 putative membrane protein [Mobilisporobacter senegalensis]